MLTLSPVCLRVDPFPGSTYRPRMKTHLAYTEASRAAADSQALVLVGRATQLLAGPFQSLLSEPVRALLPRMVDSLKPGDAGASTTGWLPDGVLERVVVCVLPEPCSRHNSPSRPHAITELVGKSIPAVSATGVLVALEDEVHAFAAGCAVARALPEFNEKSLVGDAETSAERSVQVGLVGPTGTTVEVTGLEDAVAGIRFAARLVDTPTSKLHSDALVDEARRVAAEVGASIKVIRGEELAQQGFGGLWGVGKAAVHPPALVVLSHEPEGADSTVAWVGKGIVYDTGGLSIKSKTGMPGMKTDMGGAAAVLAAFGAAVQASFPDRLFALLCIAENSVGPEATRPDDILTMYSGKTVEVNNTDAEGRLVLADGVAYAVSELGADVVVDLATLTGAQMVATGQRHAAIVCNDESLEQSAVKAGRVCGELVHPLPYCPEFFRKEFKSKLADMRNSVKDRGNAQSSCAGQFVAEHLGDYGGRWLHVDLAGPSVSDDRGTGFGVGLLLELFVRSRV